MDKPTAEQLMSIYERIGGALNETLPLLNVLPEGERELHLRAVGKLVMDIWKTLQRPIVQEYPELDPDGLWSNPQLQRTPDGAAE
jgi:hypothetical protein